MNKTVWGALLAGTALGLTAFVAWHQPSAQQHQADLQRILVPNRSLCAGVAAGPGQTPLSTKTAFDVLGEALISQAVAEDAAHPSEQPLWVGLGPANWAITTNSDKAKAYFNQGLRLSFNFNHHAAIRAFKIAQAADPDCAICYWGEAFALGPNINAPMAPEANGPALAATAKAVAVKDKASRWEQALIDAIATRYSQDNDRAALDLAFAEAMLAVADAYPDNDDIAALAIEAQMDTTPWDYWQADLRTPKGQMGHAWPRIQALLEKSPDHPAAIHLFIHITEASANPAAAEPYAEKLAGLAPNAGHLVHMPGHTFYRLGRFKDSIETNIKAVSIDEAYIADTGAQSLYTFAYYPHNVHFVMASALMAGNGAMAARYAEKLLPLMPAHVAAVTPLVQPILAAPLYALGEFEAPGALLARANPAPKVPYVSIAWHYARGLAHLRNGDIDLAQSELGAMDDRADADFDKEHAHGVPAADVASLTSAVLEARIALAEGDFDTAETAYREAVKVQDRLRYTEPPFWYYPVRRSLGAVLLRQGKLAEAEQIFRASLSKQPNDGWALYGLAATYRKMGASVEADAVTALFEAAWDGKGLSEDRL